MPPVMNSFVHLPHQWLPLLICHDTGPAYHPGKDRGISHSICVSQGPQRNRCQKRTRQARELLEGECEKWVEGAGVAGDAIKQQWGL